MINGAFGAPFFLFHTPKMAQKNYVISELNSEIA